MWFLILFILVALAGVRGDDSDDSDQCAEIFRQDRNVVDSILEFRGKNDLEIFCPNVRESLDCIDKRIQERTGLMLDTIAVEIEDLEIARMLSFVRNVKSLLEDICDTDSQLNKDYKEHIECIRSIDSTDASNDLKECLDLTESLFDTSSDSEDEHINNVERCMIHAYDAACRGIGIHEKCGKNAFDTYMKVIRRSTIIRIRFCGDDVLEEAKNKFFANVEEDNVHRNLYNLAFDFRRK